MWPFKFLDEKPLFHKNPDQFFGQFTVMFLILWSIYCDVSNCDCNNIRAYINMV